MSYAMTHLIIANEFAKHKSIKNKDLFLLASIAPDAVHARENFILEMKAASHYMQEGERWGEMYEEEAMIIWYRRLEKIYKEKLKLAKTDEDVAFLQGYVVHMLTDVFNCALLYAPFLIKNDFKVESFRVEYRNECVVQDAWLYQNYQESDEIMKSLEIAMERDLSEDILKNLELDMHMTVKNIIDNTHFQARLFAEGKKASLDGLKMTTRELTEFFIKRVLSECERMLFDFPDCGESFKVRPVGI